MCFQGLFVRRGMGQRGLEWKPRDEIIKHFGSHFVKYGASRWMLVNNLDQSYFVSA
jgi:hypothetical protein